MKRRGRAHGQYNTLTGLPDNAMQPVGSGYNVWLNEQILATFGTIEGQRLIDESSTHKAHRYTWLCSVLVERGHQGVVDEYHRRRLAADAERRLDERRSYLRNWQAQLAEDQGQRRVFLEREIAKCEKYIAERSGK